MPFDWFGRKMVGWGIMVPKRSNDVRTSPDNTFVYVETRLKSTIVHRGCYCRARWPFTGFRAFAQESLKNLMCVLPFVRSSVRPFVRPFVTHLFWTLSGPSFASFKAILSKRGSKKGPFCDIWTKSSQFGPSI